MASARRERLFEEYRNRKIHANSLFKNCFLLLIIPFGGLWLAIALYSFIRGLALLAGGSFFWANYIMNYVNGTNESSGLVYVMPLGLMLYLFAVAGFATLSRIFRKKLFNFILMGIFIASFIYGMLCLFARSMEIWKSVLLMVQGFYGFWCCDVINRSYKEFSFLSKQEGWPDFVDLVGEPVPIANTRGIYLRQYELLKEHAKKLKSEPTEESAVNIDDYISKSGGDGAMDELTTDFGDSIEELLKKTK